jgi:predicted porin
VVPGSKRCLRSRDDVRRSALEGRKRYASAGVASAAALLSAGAIAQTTSFDDGGLTWHGITLYGVIDAGLQYETHGAPFSNYYLTGGGEIVQKNSNNPVVGITSNGLSQSKIGLQGKESLHFLDFSGVFKLESYFNPASGQLTNALESLTQNNGRPLNQQSTNVDSNIAGEPFEQALVGISSPRWGTMTFGRQTSTLSDLFALYDPQQVSYAFSLVGLSGTPAGGGDTQDRRIDDSLKYSANLFDRVHVGLLYKFQDATAARYPLAGHGEAFTAAQISLGTEFGGASLDAFYSKARDAVSAAALSPEQAAELPQLGYALDNSLAGTISDNAAYGILTSYAAGPAILYGAYEHITYANPSINLAPGFEDIGGYTLAYVNNTAYAAASKILQVYWAGARYVVTEKLTAALAYYGEAQNAYASGADRNCSSTVSAKCSGHFGAVSASFVYRFTKRLDSYAGAMWSNVSHGLANGYLETTTIDPTIGLRFSF